MSARGGDRRARALAVVAACAAIAAATLTPQQPLARLSPWWLPFTGAGDGADALLNVVLFVPLGLALALAGARRGRAVLVALLVTATVELLQAFVIPGRQASVGDVMTNTLGGWAGHVLHDVVAAGWRARAAAARRFAIASAAAWLAATVGGAALLRPSTEAPGGPTRCGSRAPLSPCFPGRVIARSAGMASLAVTVLDGGMAWRPGIVAGVDGAAGDGLMVLEQRFDWLLFLARTRGAALGLRSPAVALPGAIGWEGRQLTVRAGVDGNRRWLESDGRRAELSPSAADWWRLLFPWSAASGGIIRTVGFFFHAITLLPTAFWLARWMGAAPAGALGVGLVAATLVGAGSAFELGPVAMPDWLGAALGVAVGVAASGLGRGAGLTTLRNQP
jgi:hypothetical protein